MVKLRLCETARLAFFFMRPRLSHFLNCETKTFDISEMRDQDLSIFTIHISPPNIIIVNLKMYLKNETLRPHCKKFETPRP